MTEVVVNSLHSTPNAGANVLKKTTHRATPRRISLATQVAGVEWEKHFPHVVNDLGVTVEISTYEEVSAFAAANYSSIYADDPETSPFLWLEFTDSKKKYYEVAGDFFVFRAGKEIVGVFVCTLGDWSSYYIRNAALLPPYRGQKLIQGMTSYLVECLKSYPIERVEADISPANFPNISNLTKLHFNITGLALSERWGSMLRMTKFLTAKHEGVFLNQFCHGLHPQLAGVQSLKK